MSASETCPYYSLSPELVEEIALLVYLRARDISSLALSCKHFHSIVAGSLDPPALLSVSAFRLHNLGGRLPGVTTNTQ